MKRVLSDRTKNASTYSLVLRGVVWCDALQCHALCDCVCHPFPSPVVSTANQSADKQLLTKLLSRILLIDLKKYTYDLLKNVLPVQIILLKKISTVVNKL